MGNWGRGSCFLIGERGLGTTWGALVLIGKGGGGGFKIIIGQGSGEGAPPTMGNPGSAYFLNFFKDPKIRKQTIGITKTEKTY